MFHKRTSESLSSTETNICSRPVLSLRITGGEGAQFLLVKLFQLQKLTELQHGK
jgi:hypothetical protein